MVPSDYSNFFDAASQAAGALIGLLFVVIALKPGKIMGPHAEPSARGLATSSFTGLVNAFFVSMLALIPGHNLGLGAAIMAVLSLYHTLRLHLGHPGARHYFVFALSLLAYGTELSLAIAFVLHPHDVDLINDLTFVLIGCFSVALGRAWQLMESGEHSRRNARRLCHGQSRPLSKAVDTWELDSRATPSQHRTAPASPGLSPAWGTRIPQSESLITSIPERAGFSGLVSIASKTGTEITSSMQAALAAT